MLFDRREQLAHVDPGGDQLDQTVELPAAFFAVDAAVRMGIKNAVNEFLQLIVHWFVHPLLNYHLDEGIRRDLTWFSVE